MSLEVLTKRALSILVPTSSVIKISDACDCEYLEGAENNYDIVNLNESPRSKAKVWKSNPRRRNHGVWAVW